MELTQLQLQERLCPHDSTRWSNWPGCKMGLRRDSIIGCRVSFWWWRSKDRETTVHVQVQIVTLNAAEVELVRKIRAPAAPWAGSGSEPWGALRQRALRLCVPKT